MIKYDIILSKGGAMAGILNIQLNPVLSDKEKNLLSVNKYIEQFADKNLDLVVLPEFFSTGVHQESFVNSPEDTNGGIVVEALSETARKFNTNIVCGSVIERDGDNLYNTSFVLDRSGKIVGKYRKIHLFSFFGGNENSYTTPGNLPPLVVEMDFARVGVSICFDIKYPLLYKSLIKKGAEIIVSPSAWIKLTSLLLSGMLVLGTGCGNMNNTTKGGLIGAGGGATLGAIIGGIAGKGKGAAIGAAIGTAVGTGAGVIIGKKMDKAADAARQVEGAQVEQITDANGLQAVKVTFDSGILFNTSSSSLSTSAQNSLSKFANNVLKQNNTMDIAIMGYTDNQPWRNSTAEQSVQKNQQLSLQRAQSVSNYLKNCGVSFAQIKSVEGLGESNPVADNSTAAGQAQNRRVEVYMYASEQMIREAEAAGR